MNRARPGAVLVAFSALFVTVMPGGARAQVPPNAADVPVFGRAVPRGNGTIVSEPGSPSSPKTVDGSIDDWTGSITRYGGTHVYSNGELVYQDHLFDAHGPDDGRDARRMAVMDPLAEAVPETYRLDPLAQTAGEEFGLPTPDEITYDESFGDASSHQDASDIEEVRVALDGDALLLLVRTTTMTAAGQTGVLLLAGTTGTEQEWTIPFGSGLTTAIADHAVFLAGATGKVARLGSEETTPLPASSVATEPTGFTNAIEARIPLSELGGAPPRALAVATGPADEDGSGFAHLTLDFDDDLPHPNIANVAFRTDEPVQVWLEKQQALTLNSGTIDPFFVAPDSDRLASGVAETYVPGPGYHDRIFISDSTPNIVAERGRDGLFQHYGIYLPSSYDGSPTPLQWWLHWRGGKAHTAGSVIPRMFKHFGEELDTIVVSPSARGTSTWYVWKGHVDFLEVWDDVFETFAVDHQRVYVSGHSMGGFGSYLFTVLYPDRFAAAAPVAGPVTQGAWTGADVPGCDNLRFDDGDDYYTPCFVGVNQGRGRDQHTRKLLENARHVGYAILQGTNDELVWYPGVARQSERLIELGYRHRFYSYPGYEHYSHPIADQWSEAARYLHSFVAPSDPARVTYKRDMLFERATEEVQAPTAADHLDLSFDSAYWMSDLTPTDLQAGSALFDGRSLAIPEEPFVTLPDTGPPTATGSTGPFVITGLQWLDDPTTSAEAASNGFDISLTGARAVTLDLTRMDITISDPIAGTVATESELTLSLKGPWNSVPGVTVDGDPATVALQAGELVVTIPAGSHAVAIAPSAAEPTDSVLTLEVTGNGAKRLLVATLTDANTGSGIAARAVSFFADGDEICRPEPVTDDAGRATCDPPGRYHGGHRTYTAAFGGDDFYRPSSASTAT